MNIGIDIYPLSKQFQGISVYLYNLLTHLYSIDTENTYFLYTYPFASLRLPFKSNASWRLCFKKGRLNRSATAWMQWTAKNDLRNDAIDVFWAPEGILPLNLPAAVKTVLTVHDLTYYFYPSTLKWNNRLIFPLFFQRSLLKATTIVTVSHSVAAEIKGIFPRFSPKIISLHSGIIQSSSKKPGKEESRRYIAEKFQTSTDYILTVATLEPRKNIENLLEGYAQFKKNGLCRKYQLLIAGAAGWKTSSLGRLYARLKLSQEEVKFLGYVPAEDMARLYAGAELFIFPSLYEGFGFPPLEALSYGSPVIASDIPVLKETLEDAAFFINPHSPENIALSLRYVLNDTKLKKELMAKGMERIKQFCWEKTAQGMLELFRQLNKK
ncbi:MAG: glycosyltransferase family 1 protein [Candidatus Omnitrophica bacterium]|nr:glycosyltransferase family 1 protein [Candidatus Omnitrophota bacterium]